VGEGGIQLSTFNFQLLTNQPLADFG